jgi:hypothetical protein
VSNPQKKSTKERQKMKKRDLIRNIGYYTDVSPIMAIRLCCWSEARLQRVFRTLKAINEVYDDTKDNKIKAFARYIK